MHRPMQRRTHRDGKPAGNLQNELRVDDRKHHKGMAYYPLRHYHGVSIFLEVHAAQKSLDEMFHGFSIDLKPYYDKTQMEKIRAIHEQITSNLQVRVKTIRYASNKHEKMFS